MILNKEVISLKMLENFVPLLDEVGQDFVARVHKKIKRTGQNKWTTDLSQELFKYALECKTNIYLKYSILILPFLNSITHHLFLSHVCFVQYSGELSAVW